MLPIQKVGTEIMSKNPGRFYAFVGPEYGVKRTYLDLLEQVYGSSVESSSVQAVLSMMNTKHLIPLSPTLYVVRYDEDFIKSLDNNSASHIQSSNIIGTVVCIYDDLKHESKLDKYLPNYTVSFDTMSKASLLKNLQKAHQNLDTTVLNRICNICIDYADALNMANAIEVSNVGASLDDSDDAFRQLFGRDQADQSKMFRVAVASRNFNLCCKIIDECSSDLSSFFYIMLNTFSELEKCKCSTYADSDLRSCVKHWDVKDLYTMFCNVYRSLKKSRYMSMDLLDELVYLCSLLKFQPIPEV